MDALDKVITKVVGLPHKPLSLAVFWGGLSIVLYLMAQITWNLIPTPQHASVWKATGQSNSNSTSSNVDLSGIQQLALFGKHDATVEHEPVAQPELITDAPKSSLSIQLTGVVASTAKQQGLAVIDSNGEQVTYSIGDKIKGTSASLKEVYADRIIITNSGRYETVMLDGLQFTAQSSANNALHKASAKSKLRKIDQRNNKAIAARIAESRSEVMQDPNKISDYLSISPKTINGALQGYRLNPGKDRQLFKQAGFKANDLAKSINGYDLTDISQALEVMAQLPELTELSVMVERQGQLVEITFGLPQ
ncbi:type II secretion system protein GspC [Parashewanella spongiae]|uniref:Type II secretion system protein GspC n=1 Tax=Parashewanella spongiae TaxID=342950 RepID=A0A3A6U3Z2_9GAMM|nr:type II secretion system protein GspC [Parashewanella spongiae]MCL1077145.1 type II secretion system protein GspC [Parashewanella spongiae]RJY18832.1 type II secretion system protein GspC [Parashewanella spongiae]